MRQNRSDRERPGHARARTEVALDIVGVKVDQPRQQEVAFQVFARDCECRLWFDGSDLRAVKADAARDDAVGQNQLGVCEQISHSRGLSRP